MLRHASSVVFQRVDKLVRFSIEFDINLDHANALLVELDGVDQDMVESKLRLLSIEVELAELFVILLVLKHDIDAFLLDQGGTNFNELVHEGCWAALRAIVNL